MFSIIEISNFISCIGLAIVFLLLIELRYSKKITILFISIFLFLSFFAFLLLKINGVNEGAASAISITIPSFLYCFILSKRKDSRFVFSFCSVDIMGFIIIFTSRMAAIPFKDNAYIVLTVNSIGFLLLMLLTLKYRDKYLLIQRTLTSGWRSLAAVSVLFYIMIYMVSSYPTPMIERRAYIPVVILLSITIVFVYIVMYQTVMKGIRIYNEQNEKALLEKEIQLQRSQLELKEVYYRMAYTDILTGLKNRTAFEDKKKAINEGHFKANNISCLSMDLNNLKETNDLYGHSVGDELIKSFSYLLRKVFDDIEDIYRIGGDEFTIFFIEKARKEVGMGICHLKQAIEQYNSQHNIKIHVAMGLASMSKINSKDAHTLVVSADKKMYQNKKNMKEAL